MGEYNLKLGINAYERDFAGEPIIQQLNRFVEKSGVNQIEEHISLARPGTSLVQSFGTGPTRGLFSQDDVFNGDLLVISGVNLYRYSAAGVITTITGEIENNPNDVAMAVVSDSDKRRLYFADGLTLQYYDGGTQATGTLTADGSSALGGVIVQIGSEFYTWGSITAPNQNGTQANPWVAPVGLTSTDSINRLATLLNFSGFSGVDYSPSIGGPNTQVTAAASSNTLTLTAISDGTDGNTLALAVVSGTGIAASGPTMTGGGIHALHQVEVPDGKSPISLASCAGFLLLAIGGTQKFYWIAPGATTIDPLNFASAEFAPDNITDILAVADQVWIFGSASIEVWYPDTTATDLTQSFKPVAGRAFAHGALDHTAVRIRDTVYFVGRDNVVYGVGGNHIWVAGSGVQRISTNAIEERIRVALAAEAANG